MVINLNYWLTSFNFEKYRKDLPSPPFLSLKVLLERKYFVKHLTSAIALQYIIVHAQH